MYEQNQRMALSQECISQSLLYEERRMEVGYGWVQRYFKTFIAHTQHLTYKKNEVAGIPKIEWNWYFDEAGDVCVH